MSEPNNEYYFIGAEGNMGELTRAKDWSQTPLGDPSTWPVSLRTAICMMLENPFAMYIAWGKDYIQLYNDAYRPILGNTKHPQALGTSSKDTFSEIWHIIKPMFDDVMQGNSIRRSDLMLQLNRNGFEEDCYFDFSYSPIKTENDKVGGILVTVIETTNKVKVVTELKESETRFRNLADNIPNLTWMANADGYIFWYNKQWYDYTGTTPQQMEGWGWQSVHHPKGLPEVLKKWKSAIENEVVFEMTFPIRRADGEFGQFLTRVVPLKDADGKVYQWFGSNTDITFQQKAEQDIRESEERFRSMAESADIFIAIGDETGNAVYFNQAWTKFTGRETKELLNFGWVDLIHKDDADLLVKKYLDAFENRKPWQGEFRVLNSDNEYRWLFAKGSVRTLPDGGFAGFISTCIDLTELKNTEEILKESENKFRSITENIPHLVWETDQKGEFLYGSERWLQYTGRKPGYKNEWKTIIHTDDYENIMALWNHSLKTGEHYKVELRIKNAAGIYRWHSGNAQPLYNNNRTIVKWVGTFNDIHAEKNFTQELEKQVQARTEELANTNDTLKNKNEELLIMNKELQSFAYISSHDLQEPLRKIQTFTSLLLEKELENISPAGKNYFGRIQNAALRMQNLIQDLLAYSRTTYEHKNFETVDLVELINQVKEELSEEIALTKTQIQINNTALIEVIPFQFRQLLHNLFSNAIKFAKPETTPRIIVEIKLVTGDNINDHNAVQHANYFYITILDDGIGFDPIYNYRIFELFQRLNGKAFFAGTGVGLAIVKKIVQNHKGFITAEGVPGDGAIFNIYIPASK